MVSSALPQEREGDRRVAVAAVVESAPAKHIYLAQFTFEGVCRNARESSTQDKAVDVFTSFGVTMDSKRACGVCGELIKKHTCVHYGAVSCYSCRAFFRRAHQSAMKSPIFRCKCQQQEQRQETPTPETARAWRRCQKCRYQRCLAAGMRPELVLSQEEKESRFMRYYEKKSNVTTSTDAGASSSNAKKSTKKKSESCKKAQPQKKKAISEKSETTERPKDPANAGPPGIKIEPELDVKKENKEVREDPKEDDDEHDAATLFIDLPMDDVERIASSSITSPLSKDYVTADFVQDDRLREIIEDLQACENLVSWKKDFREQVRSNFYEPSLESTSRSSMAPPLKIDPNSSHSMELEREFFRCPPSDSGLVPSVDLVWAEGLFSRTCTEISMSHLNAAKHFVLFHQFRYLYHKSDFQDVLCMVLEQFDAFVRKLKPFSALPPEDQEKLLVRNRKLFLMFVLGNYFSANSGFEQLSWILGPCSKHLQGIDEAGLHFIPFQNFTNSLNIFEQTTGTTSYLLDLSFDLRRSRMRPDQKHLIALFFAFYQEQDMLLKRSALVRATFDNIMCHLTRFSWCPIFSHQSLGNILRTTLSMVEIFDVSFTWKVFERSNNIRMPLTFEETQWMQLHLCKFDQAFRSVPLGEDLTREYIMHSYGIPLSQNFFATSNKIFVERFRRILLHYPEYSNLNPLNRHTVWMSGAAKASILFMMLLESSTTGIQQLRLALGELDTQIWETRYRPYLSETQLRLVSLMNLNFDASKSLKDSIILEYVTTAKRIMDVVRSQNMFKLLILLVLFSSSQPPIQAVKERYLSLLERGTANNGNHHLSTILNGLQDVNRLVFFMQVLRNVL